MGKRTKKLKNQKTKRLVKSGKTDRRGKLTVEEVRKVAKLANLELTDEEVNLFREQLAQILSYVDKLQEVDTSGVEMTSQVTGLVNVDRSDEVGNERTLSQEASLSGTKKKHKGYFMTKGVLGGS
jgi:aspartyl-tRNA(Asn)/glutamyl-tRNA(Gln) amidotransferase subunit C